MPRFSWSWRNTGLDTFGQLVCFIFLSLFFLFLFFFSLSLVLFGGFFRRFGCWWSISIKQGVDHGGFSHIRSSTKSYLRNLVRRNSIQQCWHLIGWSVNFRHHSHRKGIRSKGQGRRRLNSLGLFVLARNAFEKDLTRFSSNPASIRHGIHPRGSSLTRHNSHAHTANIGENSGIHRDFAKELSVAFGFLDFLLHIS